MDFRSFSEPTNLPPSFLGRSVQTHLVNCFFTNSRDMGMSFGLPDAHDPPYPKEMDEARSIVKSACEKSGVFVYSSWLDPEMNDKQRIKYIIEELNVKITGADSKEYADEGRR